MATRNVVLTDHQNALIDDLVASGRYQNASEAMRAGLRLLEVEEEAVKALRERLTESIRQAEAGEFSEGTPEEVIKRAFAAASESYEAGAKAKP